MIDAALVAKVAALYEQHRQDATCSDIMRKEFPELRITYCSDDEIGKGEPVLKQQYFNIYLFGGTHCLTLTKDYDDANGIVIAEVEEDEA